MLVCNLALPIGNTNTQTSVVYCKLGVSSNTCQQPASIEVSRWLRFSIRATVLHRIAAAVRPWAWHNRSTPSPRHYDSMIQHLIAESRARIQCLTPSLDQFRRTDARHSRQLRNHRFYSGQSILTIMASRL